MSILPTFKSDEYSDGRTKQSFKDRTDINKILQKAQRTGTISHLNQHGPMYGDFADFDFDAAKFALAKANRIFEALPSELRREFDHSPKKFFNFVNDPANKDRLPELLPEIAKPGRYFPDVLSKAVQAGVTAARAAESAEGADDGVGPSKSAKEPEKGSGSESKA